jgi:peroxin-19
MTDMLVTDDYADDILDGALDEFEDDLNGDEEGDAMGAIKKAAALTNSTGSTPGPNSGQMDDMAAAMGSLMEEMKNPEFASTLEDTFKQLAAGGSAGSLDNPFSGKGPGPNGPGNAPMDASVANTLKMLAETGKDLEGTDSAAAEAMGEDMMNSIMGEFEKLGEKEDFQDIMDGMMRQLLSKDVMYDPMKQITGKFPEWLAEHEDTLPAEDYERYGRMYQYFQKIVAVYESEPNNHQRLMELMQDMQECGQPPAEIVKELAPGLEFGPDGMPIMTNMGSGVPMPPIPGMPPFPGLAGQQNCVVQ